MEYFILSVQDGNPIPRIVNWYDKLDLKKDTGEHVLLDMKTGVDIFYPDVLMNPVFMVSKEVMKVIRMYEPELPFRYVVLFDIEREESVSYYCPILEEDTEEAAIYCKRSGDMTEILLRLDLTESLFRRGIKGVSIKRMDKNMEGK